MTSATSMMAVYIGWLAIPAATMMYSLMNKGDGGVAKSSIVIMAKSVPVNGSTEITPETLENFVLLNRKTILPAPKKSADFANE